MTVIPGWLDDGRLLRSIGLKLVNVSRYGRAARWIACHSCGEGLAALWCTDCGWRLEEYLSSYAHLAGLRQLPRLYLMTCPRGCNRSLVEHPPAALLVAQAEDAARQDIEAPPRPTRKPKVLS